MDTEFKKPILDTSKINQKKNSDESKSEKNQDVSCSIPKSSTANIIALPAKVENNEKVKCPYKEPKWSKTPEPDLNYNFEVLKGGQIVETINDLQNKSYWSIGKMANNHIVMAHPTVSRYHAILQYRPIVDGDDGGNSNDEEDNANAATDCDNLAVKPKIEKGWYLYDLDSTHGSFLNKTKVPAKTYVRVRVGYMLKFGASTRNYILQGPDFDVEAESELSITEMKEMRLVKEQQKLQQQEEEKRKETDGINWGIAEDANIETDLSYNPYAETNNEELFLQDPKKTLRGFFEREGLDLDYQVDEMSSGSYVCRYR